MTVEMDGDLYWGRIWGLALGLVFHPARGALPGGLEFNLVLGPLAAALVVEWRQTDAMPR